MPADPLTQIMTLPELERAAIQKKAVVCPLSRDWNRPRPAAFVLNLNGPVLLRLFRSGMFIYTKK